MDEKTAESYRWCRQLCRSSGSSFCWTFVLLPRAQCAAMYALYAFARITDDLSDGEGTPALKRTLLDTWLQQTESLDSNLLCMDQTVSSSPATLTPPNSQSVGSSTPLGEWLWPALRHALQTYEIPKHLLIDIVRGVQMDLDHQPPQNWRELEDYCYHVASAVGLACTHIWQANESMPEQVAIDCGIAFQLTNILRDLSADAKMGRIYLPLSELERFGIESSKWLNGCPNGDLQGLIRAVGERTEELYESGWETIHYLPAPSRRLFSLMWRYYHALLREVLRNGDQLWETPRTRIPRLVRARLAAQHFIAPWYWVLPKPIH